MNKDEPVRKKAKQIEDTLTGAQWVISNLQRTCHKNNQWGARLESTACYESSAIHKAMCTIYDGMANTTYYANTQTTPYIEAI